MAARSGASALPSRLTDLEPCEPTRAPDNGRGGTPMTTWTNDELDRIAAADELELSSVGQDGSLRMPVTIWVVRHGDDLYVRSVRGRTSSWFPGTQDCHEGYIRAGG